MSLLPCSLALIALQAPPARVALVRVPEDGLQPRGVVDEAGVLHVVYLTGDPAAGDLRYALSKDGGATFSRPLPVNCGGAKAMAIGSVRGAQIALGREGRVHVAWNGVVAGAAGEHRPSPMLYTRLAGDEFEPERDVIAEHGGLDGGGAVAADGAGRVYVVWHAPGEGSGEEARRVFARVSRDDGRSFEPERALSPAGSGVCPCCGLGALAGGEGELAILFRGAHDGDARDTLLLRSGAEPGGAVQARVLDPWKVPT